MEIRELTSDAEILDAFPLMAELRDRISSETFLGEVRLQEKDGYRLAGAFVEGRLVALVGYRPGRTLARGPHLFVDDLVTAKRIQGKGFGRAMMRYLGERARAAGFPRVYLDSRATAQGFYERLGLTFLTSIPCWIETEKLLE